MEKAEKRTVLMYRKYDWYLPYYCEINNREYKVENIKFYEGGEVIAQTRGWLETERNGDIKEIELPAGKITLRRKENFNGEVFALIYKDDFNKTVTDIYIPAQMVGLKSCGYKIWNCQQLYKIFRGDNNIYIEQFIKTVDGRAREIEKEYKQLYEQVSDYAVYYEINDSGAHLLELLAKMADLVKEMAKEKERLKALNAEECATNG